MTVMARKATATKSKKKVAKRKGGLFSMKPLHDRFDSTITQLKKGKQTGSKKALLQRLLNAQKALRCPQGMLFDLSQATFAAAKTGRHQ
jgi:hypothetical protein